MRAVALPRLIPEVDPSAVLVLIEMLPALRVVTPVNVFVPPRTSVPLPDWVRFPVPLMLLAKSVPCVMVLERLKTSVALLVMALLTERDPVVLLLPIWRVPAVIVVAPVYVFAPDRIQVPVPAFVRLVRLPVLFTTAPAISPMPAVDPCKVRVLLPPPVAVKLLVNCSVPVPDWSMVALPVVPARFIVLLVVFPLPV